MTTLRLSPTRRATLAEVPNAKARDRAQTSEALRKLLTTGNPPPGWGCWASCAECGVRIDAWREHIGSFVALDDERSLMRMAFANACKECGSSHVTVHLTPAPAGFPVLTPSRRKRILVVEDDASIRALIVHTLERDYEPVVASDGADALKVIAGCGGVDLIVCDSMMPRIDGVTFTKIVKTSPLLKATPVLFLSARIDARNVLEAVGAGASHYMTKPFARKDLLARVQSLVDHESERVTRGHPSL